ncbi:MAG: DUF3455 domain-containing protein [Meiothermus sp.]|nr:DUF3455 domain-containing protein [Meiothermus sp.]
MSLIIAASLLGTVGAIATAQDYDYAAQAAQGVPSAPAELAVPAGNSLLMKVLADGVQIYACSAKADNSGYEWVLKAPDAVLTDDKGSKLGTHYGGPSWESIDGSKITGALRARANSTDPNAIPWLLLETRSAGKQGAFAKVSFIQRLETVGGKAPASGCTRASLNTEARVGYTATYYLYGSK